MKLLQTGKRGRPATNTANERGIIRVTFTLIKGGKTVAGNITKSFSIEDATVSNVFNKVKGFISGASAA